MEGGLGGVSGRVEGGLVVDGSEGVLEGSSECVSQGVCRMEYSNDHAAKGVGIVRGRVSGCERGRVRRVCHKVCEDGVQR